MAEKAPLLARGGDEVGDLVADDVTVRASGVTILKNICATWRRGCLSAIMGGSGAGKTTLLTCLIGDLAEECVQGKVGFGAAAMTVAERRRACALVPQDDIMPTTLSPRMILTFAAALKGVGDIGARVDALLVDLGLETCADTIVGEFGEGVGISGGQRKRCSIGMELVDDSGSCLCADEPTSGLDSSLAESVVEVLSAVARGASSGSDGKEESKDVEGGKAFGRRKVVIATIHQPSWLTIARFDCLTLLASGKVVYHGPTTPMLGHFFSAPPGDAPAGVLAAESFKVADGSPVGWPFPMDNPIDEIMRRVKTESGAKLAVDAWAKTRKGRAGAKLRDADGDDGDVDGVPLVAQTCILLRRFMVDFVRNKARLRVFMARPVLALILGAVFWNKGENMSMADAGVISGLMCIIMLNTALQTMGATVLLVPRMKALVRREHRNGLYAVGPWFAAYALSTMILEAAALVPFVGIVYPMTSLDGDPANVFKFFLAIYAVVLNGVMVGIAGGAMCKDYITVVQMYMPLARDFILLGCVLVWFTGCAFLSLRQSVRETETARAEKAEPFAVPCNEASYCAFPRNRLASQASDITITPSDAPKAGGLKPSISSPDLMDDVATARDVAPDLSACDLSIAVSSATVQEKVVLEGVTATWRGGACGAVMGGSGAGKSTLMNSLIGDVGSASGRRVVAGRVSLGHAAAEKRLRRESSCLVPQDDVMFETLTPRQILTFAGRLRGIAAYDADAVVEETLELLSLVKCADTPICPGAGGRGVSGGERKRCSIGMELIRPEVPVGARFAVLAADEPTTGLDSARAEEVTGTLRRVAKATGAVVIATIHQPSMRILELSFDTISLLQTGRLVYHGPVQSVVDYFSANLSWAPGANENPLDTYMNRLREEVGGGRTSNAQAAVQVWRASVLYRADLEESAAKATPAEEAAVTAFLTPPTRLHRLQHSLLPRNVFRKLEKLSSARYGQDYAAQFGLLFYRNVVDAVSNPYIFAAFMGIRLGLGIVFGLLWYRDAESPVLANDASTLDSLLFITLVCGSGTAMVQTIIFVPDMKNLVRREVQNGLFAFGPWLASQLLFMLLFHAGGALCLTAPLVLLIDSRGKFFLPFAALVFLGPCLFMFVGLFFGAANPSKDFDPARQKGVTVLTLMVLFCGLMIPYPELQDWCKPIYKLDPFQHLYNAALIAFWRGMDFKGSCSDDLVGKDVCFNTGAEYLESLNVSPDQYMYHVHSFFGPIVLFAVLSTAALYRVAYY
ncbi:ABC transporter [Aureococcus anophagefferens]|uniref:ABC transporter n=1 Tax=Aureococcus anophagefferens TaxID=44056 RepID=A0ABR1FMA6_AURAN